MGVEKSYEDLIIDVYEGHFYQVNGLLVAEIGFMAAVFFEIIFKWGRRVTNQKIPSKFYMSSAEITSMHGLTYKQQYNLFNKLESLELITCEVNRKARRKYITSINYDKLGDIFSKQSDIRDEKIKKAKEVRKTFYKNK